MIGNVRRAAIAGFVVAAAGAVALGTIGPLLSGGDTWRTINELALLVMTAAIPFLMLAFWELGGLTPTPLARLALTSGWLAVVAWCAVQLLVVLGAMDLDRTLPATGAFAVQAAALAVIGLWIAGANLLAGPWLSALRWLGVVTGLGVALFGAGMLIGDKDSLPVSVGGVAYLVLLPLWAFAMGLYLRRSAHGGFA